MTGKETLMPQDDALVNFWGFGRSAKHPTRRVRIHGDLRFEGV